MRCEPFTHSWSFVRAEVIQDDVQFLTRSDAPIQQFEEGQELLAIGLVRNLSNYFACQRVEGSVQGRSTVALVVVRRLPMRLGFSGKPG